MLGYGYQQSFRFRPCFNCDGYVNYLKEKIIRYAVEVVKTDFILFDNFDLNHPRDADHNPATIAAFRKYIGDKYTPAKRTERFGFDDVSNFLPPMWNDSNPADKMVEINDPLIQEWVDFRCWTLATRLAECARFVRSLNKEIVIQVNSNGGLNGYNKAWLEGIDQSNLMQYTNVIFDEEINNPKWENGVVTGKFRSYKLGRTTNNFITTYNSTPQDFAEYLALNRTIGYLGWSVPVGLDKKYLDFWLANKEFYIHAKGAEQVAVLRSYPSMAYNTTATHLAVNMAEQVLQQRQIPFDIIFDQQLGQLDKYYVIVLADQESLTDETIKALKTFTANGGGLVVTGNTGKLDGWRRPRKENMLQEMLSEKGTVTSGPVEASPQGTINNVFSFNYGMGRVIYLPELIKPTGEIPLGWSTRWVMPENANELESAVFWAARKTFPLQVTAPEWVGVSHDTQENRDVVHLFNYNAASNVGGIIIQYDGLVKKAWSFSPDGEDKTIIPIIEKGGSTELRIPSLKVYTVIVLER